MRDQIYIYNGGETSEEESQASTQPQNRGLSQNVYPRQRVVEKKTKSNYMYIMYRYNQALIANLTPFYNPQVK